MNIKLLEYLKRYEFTPSKYTQFFTSIEKEQFDASAPYLVDVEHFNVRLSQALVGDHKICIYSDYDADAITATATMYWGLILLGFDPNNITYYAPDRFTEGYGINPEAIKKLAKANDLIISVDCGINSVIEASICLESNCDLIITDHHVLSGTIPQALAVINPRLTEEYQKNYLARRMRESTFENSFPSQIFKFGIKEDYVSASVCGVGVAWFCLLHLANYLNKNPNLLNLLLPFVAIGTIADCQSIRDNQNRLLVKAGLKMFPQAMARFSGLNALVTQAGLMEKIELGLLSSQDLGFSLAPMLNAAGRIDHANVAINLLCTSNITQADKLATQIIDINTQRKAMVKEASISALGEVDSDAHVNFLITDYSKGIVGLIASKLLDKNNKVSVVISKDPEGYSSASLRAPKGYNLVEIMKQIKPGLLKKFGGHPEAAGFSCENDYCEAIGDEFERILADYTPIEEQSIDYIPSKLNLSEYNKKNIIYLDSSDLSDSLFNDLSNLEPFGQDFQMPKFLTYIKNYSISYMGQMQNHARIKFNGFDFVMFNIEPSTKIILEDNQEIMVLFKTSKNIFRSNVSNQLVIDNIEPKKH
jgi:single-stranded-DNA-specific exonuclease